MDHTEIELPLLQPTHFTCVILFSLPYRIVDYLLLAGLVWEKNTISGWKFTIVYEQSNRLLEAGTFFYCLTELQHYFYSKNELLTPIGSAPIKRIVVCGTQFCQINEAPWLFHICLDQCSWVAKNSKRPSNSLSNNPKSQTNKQTGIHLFICSYTHLNSLSMQQKDLLSIVLICMINCSSPYPLPVLLTAAWTGHNANPAALHYQLQLSPFLLI